MKKEDLKRNYIVVFIAGIVLTSILFSLKPVENINYDVSNFKSFSTNMIVPAIDDTGKGTTVNLYVEIKPGQNRVLTNIDKLIFWIDTQASIKLAKETAENITGIDTKNIDIIYSINNKKEGFVGGPSAGAALTIATIAALEHKELKPNISITGTIEKEGKIGKVGGILEKAKAAKSDGIETLLIPKGERYETRLIPKKECDNSNFCSVRFENTTIDVSKEVNIMLVEIDDINQALELMFS